MKKSKGRMLSPELGITGVELKDDSHPLAAVIFRYIDGDVISKRSGFGKCYPLVEQKLYAENLCRFLNKDIAFDKGSWQCVWTQPCKSYYNRMSGIYQAYVPELLECQYLDKDGDIHVVVEFEENVWDLLTHFSFTEVAGLCTQAFEQWKALEKEVGAKEHQKYSPANGQKPIDENVYIPGLI